MSLLNAMRYRLRVLLHSRAHARQLDEEFQFHLSLEAMQREHAARGALSTTDARFAARRRFGNVTALAEETRQMAGLGFWDMVRQDLRFALRTFRRTPGFTIVAVLTLAVGIGANTAIFSAVNALLLRPLPFAEPERLMAVSLVMPPRPGEPVRDGMVWSYPKFTVFRDAQPVYSDVTLYTDLQLTLRGDGEAERVEGEVTDAGYLTTLGVRPALGRNFAVEEVSRPGGPRVALLSDALWQRRFNADPLVLGRSLNVDGEPYTVVGVLPPGFRGLSGQAELWVPILAHDATAYEQAWSHSFSLVARLAPGVSPARAQAVVEQLGTRVDRAFPHPEIASEHWGAAARPLDAARVDPTVRRSLLVLLGAVALVLLIACANVANLFLVRAAGRRREIAVRLAIGAGRRRLVRQLLTESVLLSALGGVAGIAVAWWGVRVLAALDPSSTLQAQRLTGLGAVGFDSIRLDPTAFAFAAVLAVGTGLLFGLVPALQATRPSFTGALKDEDPRARAGGRRGVSSRSVLAVAEIALALVLLAGSGLMLRSLGNLLGVHPGFDATQVLTLRLNTAEGLGRDSLPGFYDELLERFGALPGVTDVALSDCPPLNGQCNGTVVALRDRPPVTPGSEPSVGVHWVTPSWFSTLRVPLQRGRLFTDADRGGQRKVVLVSETAARTIWPGEDPIGRPVSVGQGGFWQDTAYVVGVVGDVRFGTLDSLPVPEVYLSYYQSPRGRMMLFARTAGDPLAVAAAARGVVRSMAPDAPVYDIRTLESRVGDTMAYARFSALLLALFALVALALATMGTYGVISFAVSQRTREIGVRVALGATRGDILRMVVGQGVGIAVAGAVCGLVAALGATRVLRSLLFGVAPSDPVTFAAIAALLVGVVVVASWVPARRAASIPPLRALRDG
ncbi:MAG TPA: ABC transporter permease [Gemmatimonadaceae bacterium]|nr:ABC transporter permease [Gemmatimonadaceae bacterium]